MGNSGDDAPYTPGAPKQSRPKRARTKAEKKEVVTETVARFHCNYCARDLSHQIRARCAICPDYDSCLDCFSVGAALAPHKASHDYRLIEVMHAPIYQIGWSADEEEKLLEGLEMYGVGNWEQVASTIGTKNADETEQHFLRVYMQPAYAPLPDICRIIPADKGTQEQGTDVDPKALRVMHKHQNEDAAGWMSKREDFVYEWDNEAEDILGDMEITDEDSPEDRELKIRVLEIYNTKLDGRAKRKQFVLDRGMIDFKKYLDLDKKKTKEDKDVREKLKPFARFLSHSEFERCVEGVLEERKVRAQIEAYKEGRAQGAKTSGDAVRFARQSSKNRGGTAPRNVNGGAIPESSNPSDAELRTMLIGKEPDVTQQAGSELLSRAELQLCTALKITVHQYMIVKELLIRECARIGHLKKKDAKGMVRLDPTKVMKIYDYLLGCGWIRVPSSTS